MFPLSEYFLIVGKGAGTELAKASALASLATNPVVRNPLTSASCEKRLTTCFK